ncbi:MAG: S41 family peptidase [Candidatus Parcubacteria bacterium]|nr:S41 family peptidase [Candidatus Paceibacterota bacterium]
MSNPILEEPKKSGAQFHLIGLKVLCSILVILLVIVSSALVAVLLTSPINDVSLKSLIQAKYYKTPPTAQQYELGQLKGIVSALDDPYSDYLSKKEYQQFNSDLNRQYEGVGIEFDFETPDKTVVKKTLPSSPASLLDIQPGDVLISVNGENIRGLDSQDIVGKIRGPKSSKVKLTFIRNAQNIDRELTRVKIDVELIDLTKKDKTAIITIVSFGQNLDKKMAAIAKNILADTNINRIIIDVRSDGGGLLQESIQVISYFLDKNLPIVTEKTKARESTIKSTDKNNLSLVKYPLIILTNKGTASASEILVGALQDHRDIPTVGQKTYGKGVVQEVIELPNGDSLKITTAEWLTPKGRQIDKQGIKPTREVDSKTDALAIALEM